jgi:phosphoglycolate phosphatase-like HAD superfamily hydrolase
MSLMLPSSILPRALLFDMDGTITAPMLDFAAIKSEMGIGDVPILETLATLAADHRAACEAILRRHELSAALGSTLNLGCGDLLAWIGERRLATALITRNSAANVRIVFQKHRLKFDTLVSREDATPKPDPRSIHLACRRLGILPGQAWMIGDGRYDIEAGTAAGAPTVWISHGRERYFPTEPWRSVRDLAELRAMLADHDKV